MKSNNSIPNSSASHVMKLRDIQIYKMQVKVKLNIPMIPIWTVYWRTSKPSQVLLPQLRRYCF